MATFTLKRFSNPTALRSITPRYLFELLLPYRDFFRGRGMPLPHASANPRFDYEQLVKILLTPDDDTPKDLADALYYVHEMSSLEAMSALLGTISLEQLGAGANESLFQLTPADVAIRVWMHDRQILERKHAELFALDPRRFCYFQARAGTLPIFKPPTVEQLRPLESALDDVFARKLRGRGVRVFCYPHPIDCMFLVRHGEPFRREGTLSGREESSVLYRPVRFDMVVYDPRTGTLRIHAKSQWETTLYRQQFGKHVFGHMDLFPDVFRYTLEPLRIQKNTSLNCTDIAELKSVTLTEVRVRWGGVYDEVEVHRAKNLYGAMRQRNWDLPESAPLFSATFSIKFRGKDSPRLVTIQPPNVAHYSRDEDSPVVDSWLRARGFIHTPEAEGHADDGRLLQIA